ncbi:bifunctional glutamate N-acetyltransferase/amino-acid acetyltransferase ArgJ [Parvibaculaceae bacterium PLY_AMNH_Bact1]|nr:bifunctional glutamate N-acetyltransferase/amino-acid acetyltransferase ArgJ [Parvibaculaceae bacterium PLY_AMNH_Bact1]
MSKPSATSAKAAPKSGANKSGAKTVSKKAAKKKISKKASKKEALEPISPLAPKKLASLPPLAGVELATTNSGTKYKGRDDLLVARMAEGTQVGGVFTTSKTAAAPVTWCQNSLEGGLARALVVNAGNANAFTGKAGLQTVRQTASVAAAMVGCRQKDVFVASTGVIGEVLDGDAIGTALTKAVNAGDPGWEAAARAIMTTDTFPKLATKTVKIGDVDVRINGIAKGSGMIQPDLATMLVFLFTDAELPASVVQTLLMLGVRDSFNSITVDSDTSTSDTVLFFATGGAMEAAEANGITTPKISRAGDPRLRDFRDALNELMIDLAHQVVKDGEGASKFIEVKVAGATSYKAARTIALSVANSPLVKTAIAGEDANWGRIVMAVGKAGEEADRDRLKIEIGGILVAKNGVAVEGFDEKPVTRHMKGKDIKIVVDVGVGRAEATVWTCDLTHEYIRINADYRS